MGLKRTCFTIRIVTIKQSHLCILFHPQVKYNKLTTNDSRDWNLLYEKKNVSGYTHTFCSKKMCLYIFRAMQCNARGISDGHVEILQVFKIDRKKNCVWKHTENNIKCSWKYTRGIYIYTYTTQPSKMHRTYTLNKNISPINNSIVID